MSTNTHEHVTPPEFVLQSAQAALWGRGCRQPLPAGPAATLGARVHDFFAAAPEGPGVLVGALPFDPAQDDRLYQPRQVQRPVAGSPLPQAGGLPLSDAGWQVSAEPSAADYQAAVAHSVALMRAEAGQADGLRKVVLSRSLRVHGSAPIDPHQLAARLRADPRVTTYLVPLPEAAEGLAVAPMLVGATPELLVSRRGLQVRSHPLAGSARRHAEPAQDALAARQLLASRKDHDEHRMVVEAIADALAPLCSQLQVPATPTLHSTASMWHLGTHIEGVLREPRWSAAALAALLHPTPAVCGQPQARAQALINALEPLPRGFYAGAVGWTDAEGDGDWYVAIRCAQLRDGQLRLHAGAGIVAASDPARETEETSAKFRALLDALGLHEQDESSLEYPK